MKSSSLYVCHPHLTLNGLIGKTDNHWLFLQGSVILLGNDLETSRCLMIRRVSRKIGRRSKLPVVFETESLAQIAKAKLETLTRANVFIKTELIYANRVYGIAFRLDDVCGQSRKLLRCRKAHFLMRDHPTFREEIKLDWPFILPA